MAIKPDHLTTSVTLKLIFIFVVFLLVPVLLYDRFAKTDHERRSLLTANLQLQGQLTAQMLRQDLLAVAPDEMLRAQEVIDKIDRGNLRLKLLLRPNDNSGLFFIASAPVLTPTEYDKEQRAWVMSGLLTDAAKTCKGNLSEVKTFTGSSGAPELLLSITPFYTAQGCWIVVTSYPEDNPAIASLLTPFAETVEVKGALALYLIMALMVVWAGGSIWRSLRRFASLARHISQNKPGPAGTFVDMTPVRELLPIAAAMDRLVETMQRAAEAIKETSEENAHALKGPVAAIRQALEALKDGSAARSQEALQVVERSLAKLDGLIAAARRTDQDLAASITEGQSSIDISQLVQNSARAISEQLIDSSAPRLRCDVVPGLTVIGSEEAIETVVENLLENAIGFSPPGSTVKISVKRTDKAARLIFQDQGPGVPANLLPSIFDRHFSTRASEDVQDGTPHYGLGLAIVRRNVGMLGGSVTAENLAEGGFRVSVDLPLAGKRQ